MNKMIAGFISIVFTLFGCSSRDTIINKDDLTGYDYRLFQGTPAWTIAKAAEDQDTIKIAALVAKDKSLLDVREPKFGETLLQITVMTLKYNSVKTLLELGADPNTQDKYDGSSPFMDAAKIRLNDDGSYGSNPKYLVLLLKRGGDPNAEQKGPRRRNGYDGRDTPLLNACSSGYLDYVKILVDAGANVHYDNNGMTPLFHAALERRSISIVLYLIEKGVDYKRPFLKNVDGKEIYLTDVMRDWLFDLNLPEYKKKMELATFLKQNGMDYWKTAIPEQYYGLYSKEYLEKY